MKKLTVTQFATKIRNTYPNRFKNLGDVELIFKWLKEFPDDRKYLDEIDATKGGIKWGADGVINFFKKGVEKVKDKVQPTPSTPQTSDSTTQQPITTTQPPKPVQTVDVSVFNCIKNSNTKGKNLQQTKDNPEAYSFVNTDGSEFTFWSNGDFTYYDGDTTANGKWKCNGGNNFDANVDWKGTTHYYKSETNEWALTQNAKKTVYENTIKKIVSKNLKSLTK